MAQLEVTSSPHLFRGHRSTRRMMFQVILALMPAVAVSLWVFKAFALYQLGLCVLVCMISEWFFALLRGQRATLEDNSAIVTGLILGLSLPWNAPWYVSVFGSLIAIGVGKAAYGGLGSNIFNPAMVGRAFVMLSFATAMGGSAYQVQDMDELAIVTQATPMTILKSEEGPAQLDGDPVSVLKMCFAGVHNGSLGEASGLAILLGGLYLIIRHNGAWRVTVGMLATVFILGALTSVNENPIYYGLFYLTNGAVLFGAFFIATDPVSNPITPAGRWWFGIGVGVLTMVFRLFSSYPEGVMFAVLIMNAVSPLLNHVTIPKPFGKN
ncbi:MAG: RnfABCDGE type electron transport complex subunit D [Planctomycetia bacterium]|nr:RnfABCDGE type electron transport complex subunit D [Planctomycetia bacterium]